MIHRNARTVWPFKTRMLRIHHACAQNVGVDRGGRHDCTLLQFWCKVARPKVARPKVARPNLARPKMARPKMARSIYTNSRSTALAALTFEGVCLSYCRHPCSGACFQAPNGRRLTPFAGIAGWTGWTGQTGISRFPVRGGRAAPPTQEKGMWVLYHACARKWPAAPRPRALNLHTHPRPCAEVARVSEFPTPVRKSILCNSHSHSDQF